MKLLNTRINGLKIIKSQVYKDKRGFLRETFRRNIVKNIDFPFDIMSYSKKCFEGFTFSIKNSQAKIITVTYGKILDVVVDLRKIQKLLANIFL